MRSISMRRSCLYVCMSVCMSPFFENFSFTRSRILLNSAQLYTTFLKLCSSTQLYSTLLNSAQLYSNLLKSAQICSTLLNSAQLQVRKRFNGIQVWELLGYWNSVELIKQSRPLVHNHVPALTCNGMIGPVLVWFNTFSKYIVQLSYNDNSIYITSIMYIKYKG